VAFQFKVQLLNISDPPVWRRLLVPGQFTFFRFHKIIQIAFGWENAHLFQFSPKGYQSSPIIAIPNPQWDEEPVQDCKKVKLRQIFTSPGQTFTYLYDFGDDWNHQILLEETSEAKILRADCVAGKGACPPEDCGGYWGYANLQAILKDPKHPDHGGMKEWLGLSKTQTWDTSSFNLGKASQEVQKA
jgi:hypothetical protein